MTLEESAGRQLIVFCDGTNNNVTGGHNDTNVVKLCQLLADANDGGQQFFYDPGVGNPGELPGATLVDQWNRVKERIAGLAFGRGVYENIAQCYLFLMRNHQPGDAIFIFGFSRGAFTARSLSGLVNMFGILKPHMDSMVPTLLHIYFSDRAAASTAGERPNSSKNPTGSIEDITAQTSRLFASQNARNVEMQFVGIWDTVESVGVPPFSARITSAPTIVGKAFRNVRQALALDEQRAQFKPRLYSDNNGTYATRNGNPATLEQRWFRGAHCDVGGGYEPGHTGISDRALAWLVGEATLCGLRVAYNELPLLGESAVAAALFPPASASAMPDQLVHSELYETHLWALTGMALRDTTRVAVDHGTVYPVRPQEHPSVAAVAGTYPQHTMWIRKRTKGTGFWIALCLVPLLLLALGHALTNEPSTGVWWRDVLNWPSHSWSYLAQNLRFAQWQLTWWYQGDMSTSLGRFDSPRWAVTWDLVFIAAYAYLLAWFAVAAFARHAGLRRAGDPTSRWLNILGWALPLGVFSDVAEDILTWVMVTLVGSDLTMLAALAGLCMSALALCKFVGLAGVVVLCCSPARRR
ncbi:MAG: DUF2235 domain-containing protein [Burkholderiaceae bacterium]